VTALRGWELPAEPQWGAITTLPGRPPAEVLTASVRLARETICFSKSILMPDIVLGLFVNRYEVALPI
jgi:hypothetical protein